MGFVLCKRCKYVGYCTFNSSGRVTECDEFEDQDIAETFDWDLQDLVKLVLSEREGFQDGPDG